MIRFLASAIAIILLAGCASDTLPDQNGSQGIREIRITAYRYGFEPSAVTVQQGERVRLVFTSKDVEHSISSPALGIATPGFGYGEEQSVELVADLKGTYTYYCSTYCGSGHGGMQGTIIVE